MRARAATLLAACVLLPACHHSRPASRERPAFGLIRSGPDRTEIRYSDARRAEKQVLLERINRDRRIYGLDPLRYEPRAALVGDAFCLDSALAGITGHWDLQGRAPHLRWGLAGGVDFHVQNAAAVSFGSGEVPRTIEHLLLETHDAMMAENPPDDGHRRAILDPELTHVGIGLARVGGEFRMTQEFTRAAFEWIETPDRPLPAGSRAPFSGQPLPAWAIGRVEIRFEPPPKPLTLLEQRGRRTYDYPRVVRVLEPDLPRGFVRPQGLRGDFRVGRQGEFRLEFPLDSGPGYYIVMCHLWRKHSPEGRLAPATAALITALS